MMKNIVALLILGLAASCPAGSLEAGSGPESDDRLRVLVWNAWRGGNEVDRGPEKVLEVVRAVEPDLVLMQESYDIDGERPTLGRWIAGELGWSAHQSESPHLCIIAPQAFEATHFHDPWHGVGARIEDEVGRAFVAWSIWLDYRSYVTYALRDDPTMTDEALLALETDASGRFREVKALLGDVDEVSSLDPGIPTLVGGDFNCPSHLDWTVDTTRMYRHRRNLDLPVSLAMYEAGFVDVFREVHPDPIQRPGITWSPMFREKADGTVQAFDRIDRLYLRNPSEGAWSLVPIAAKTLPEGWEDDRIPVRERVFPSDHGAVVLELEWRRIERRAIDLELDSVERIAGAAPHSAFTDLLEVGGRLHAAFREGDAHVHGADGRIRILRREIDGTWGSLALLEEPGVDLRDPKLSLTPDGRIMVLCGGSDYDGRTLRGARTRVAFSDAAGESFGPVEAIVVPDEVRSDVDWLWRVTWDAEGTAWGALYQPRSDAASVRLMASEDGIHWRFVVDLPVEGVGNETTLRFGEEGVMTAIVRREGSDSRAVIGTATPPYRDWSFEALPEAIGGPDMIRSPDGRGWIVAGRRYGDEGPRTTLWWRGDGGEWETLAVLPSGGDTSYPGLVIDDDRLLVSYYSSHEGRTAVYLAECRIEIRNRDAARAGIGRRAGP
ncbi:MAG: endonuclease/exonuclease/phosphatase family protein [Planctomycetota bacterium]|nr:endonuclease/exonuclease/phosphatase family protein [Planctomycetota bacterium]